MILAGIVALVAVEGDLGKYGFASAVGAGLSVLLLNLLYRMSVSGDRDRQREQEARRYFNEHGLWPEDEEAPIGVSERQWTLPAGAVTAEQEERERRLSAVPRHSTSARSMTSRDGTARALKSGAPLASPPGSTGASGQGRQLNSVWRQPNPESVTVRHAIKGPILTRRRRYLSVRTVVSLVALASLIVPGIVAVIAAALLAF